MSDSTPNDDLIDTLRLSLVYGVGPKTRKALLERFGTATAVLAAAMSDLREVNGVGAKLAHAIADADQIDAEGEIALCREHGIDILTESNAAYPRPLREIHDPPGVLFMRGQLKPNDALAVGIVGTRHGTQYGLRQAERLAGGLARGIDHRQRAGAGNRRGGPSRRVAAGGRTIAVLASGVMNIYPPEHDKLADEVAAQGALISESPPHAQPLAGMFPQRNRIISGLSLGVIVVEAADRSGALITARHAMEQGREVFAVPGNVDSRTSRGCHQLIRDGPRLVESADDVLEELGPLVEAAPRDDGRMIHHAAELLLNELEEQVLAVIGGEATPIDQIVSDSGLPVAQVLSTLSVLEMRRLIRRLSGTTVIRP